MLDTQNIRWRRLAASLARTVGIVQLHPFWPVAQAFVSARGLSSIHPTHPGSSTKPEHLLSVPNRIDFHLFFFFLNFLWKVSWGRQRRETLSWLMQQNYVVYSSHLSGPFHYWWLFPEELHGYWLQPAGLDPWVTVIDHRSPLEGKLCTRGPTILDSRRQCMSCISYFKFHPADSEIFPRIFCFCMTFDISKQIPILMFCVAVLFCVGESNDNWLYDMLLCLLWWAIISALEEYKGTFWSLQFT